MCKGGGIENQSPFRYPESGNNYLHWRIVISIRERYLHSASKAAYPRSGAGYPEKSANGLAEYFAIIVVLTAVCG